MLEGSPVAVAARNEVDPVAPAPAVTRQEWWSLASITAAMLAVMAFWSVLVPVFGAPDEPAHLNSSVRLTQGLTWPAPGDALLYDMVYGARDEGYLPADVRSTFAELAATVDYPDGVDQMTQHPPLYYAFGAAVLNGIGFMEVRSDVVLMTLRLSGLAFALPLPLLLWASVRRLTRSPKAAVLAAAAVLAVPQLAHVFASVSNDGLTIMLCSVVVWLAVRVMTGDSRWRTALALGAALGVALLVKGTALPFIPFVAAVLLIWPRRAAVGVRLLRSFVSLGVAFVVGGWWWLLNIIRFGDLQPSGLVNSRETVPWEPGVDPNLVDFADRLWTKTAISFWGNFGRLEYPLPQMVTDLMTIGAVLVIVLYAFRRVSTRAQAIVLAALPVVLLVMLFANTWRHYLRTQQFAGMQGRYFFVALVALIAVSAIAWRQFVAAEYRVRVGLGLLCVFVGLAAMGIIRMYTGAYENDNYRVSGDGLSEWATSAPGGAASIVVAFVFVAALGATALIVTWRFVQRAPLPVGSVR